MRLVRICDCYSCVCWRCLKVGATSWFFICSHAPSHVARVFQVSIQTSIMRCLFISKWVLYPFKSACRLPRRCCRPSISLVENSYQAVWSLHVRRLNLQVHDLYSQSGNPFLCTSPQKNSRCCFYIPNCPHHACTHQFNISFHLEHLDAHHSYATVHHYLQKPHGLHQQTVYSCNS